MTASGPRAFPAATARSTASSGKLETLGVCRRGYFVEGLGGAQFALPGAVERLRQPADGDSTLVLAAADPAQPYGAAIPWPKRSARALRGWRGRTSSPSAASRRSTLSAAAGRSSAPRAGARWLRAAFEALVAHVRQAGRKRLAVERFDGEPVNETEAMPLLVEAGFLAGPRRAVLRA